LLCGIDDREHSWRVVSVAIDLAKSLSAELIFCMINPAILPNGRGPSVYRWTESYIWQVLNETVSRARGLGLWDVRCAAAQADSVADGILACADHNEADYIIIGASSRSTLMQILSGSVSRDVATKASCPVLVVRRIRGEPSESSERGILDRILISILERFSRRVA
jgi:nucleotide-binding universal stress UspA family protein